MPLTPSLPPVRPLRSVRRLAALALGALAALAALPGCGVYDGADTGTPGTPYVPPTYPAGAKVFVLDLTRTFSGEQIDVRLDGQRIVRKAVANTTDPNLAERLRVAGAPGLHELFVRVTASGVRVDQTMPIRIGTESCGAVAFERSSDAAGAALCLSVRPNAECPN